MNSKHYNPTKLVEWREQFGKTQEQVSDLIGVARETINRAETGKVASYDLLFSLCALYDKSIHELIYSKQIAVV